MYIAGKGYYQIAETLSTEKVISTLAHFVKLGIRKFPKCSDINTYHLWTSSAVKKILKCELYTGDKVQGKTTSYSHKLKKRILLPREQWDIVKDTHESIITHQMFEDVQGLLPKKQKPNKSKQTTPSILSGFIFCGDCSKPIARNTQNKDGKQYNKFYFSSYKIHGRDVCTSHYIDEELIIDVAVFCINTHAKSLEDMSKVVDKLSLNQKVKKSADFLKIKQDDLKASQREMDNIILESYEDFKDGLFDKDEYIRIKTCF